MKEMQYGINRIVEVLDKGEREMAMNTQFLT